MPPSLTVEGTKPHIPSDSQCQVQGGRGALKAGTPLKSQVVYPCEVATFHTHLSAANQNCNPNQPCCIPKSRTFARESEKSWLTSSCARFHGHKLAHDSTACHNYQSVSGPGARGQLLLLLLRNQDGIAPARSQNARSKHTIRNCGN